MLLMKNVFVCGCEKLIVGFYVVCWFVWKNLGV